jgi:hemoglobin-like flavoprotein
MIIASSDDPAIVKVILDALKTSHKEKGIKPEYYEAFRDELLETLPEFVGRHFDYDAWHACLDTIINGIKQ